MGKWEKFVGRCEKFMGRWEKFSWEGNSLGHILSEM